MKILDCSYLSPEDSAQHMIVIFGVGLVGKAIFSSLKLPPKACIFQLPMAWMDGSKFKTQLSEVFSFLLSCLASSSVERRRISVVWSAGKAGFNATTEVCLSERAHLTSCIKMMASLRCMASAEYKFYFLSSAGGLYEGLRNVSNRTLPRPLRPYGQLKLEQEQEISELRQTISINIYRPSTVYGNIKGGRLGLISTLINNGLVGRTTSIFGSAATLRDFVSAEDVGRAVARDILADTVACSGKVRFIVSGKPTSIFEVVKLTENILGKKLYVHYETRYSNALDNTYSSELRPAGFCPMSLREGMLSILQNHKSAC